MSQKPQGLYDSPMIGWIMAGALIAILAWLYWFYFHHETRDAIRWVRYAEMKIIEPFIPDDYVVTYKVSVMPEYKDVYQSLQYRRAVTEDRQVKFHEEILRVPQYKKGKMSNKHLSLFSAMTMYPLKKVMIYILVAGGMWCLFVGPGTQYRRKMKLEDLIEAQSTQFPVIRPFVKFNPSKQPPRPPGAPVPAELPAFAEALGPEEWLAYNSIPVPDGKMDEELCADGFIQQLGPRWRGVDKMAPYKQILLACFCLKAARKRNEADDMLGALARCWSFEEGFDLKADKKLLKNAQSVLRNKDLASKTLAVCNQHAFETTVMMRGLAFAREQGGVLASSQFVWLRAHDRTLWYPLNNMGRQAYHMEALGAMAHYKAEKLTRRPIPVPKVDVAVQVIRDYMKSVRARPIPQLDYSKSKKKAIKKAA